MQVENEVTEPNVGIGGGFEHIQITSQAPENEIDDSSDLEDETYAEGVVNLLDFVSELQ
jgi:hypothetical protein